jgi:hypothetical protein
VKTLIRRFLAAVTHSGPGYDPIPLPAPGDHVEAWLRAERDKHEDRFGATPAWYAVDALLNGYRYRADNGIPLNERNVDVPF